MIAQLGDEMLKTIAHALVEAVRRSVTIDWTVRENVRARIRVIVKRILRKYDRVVKSPAPRDLPL